MFPSLLVLLLAGVAPACAHVSCPPEVSVQARSRLGPELSRQIEEAPDREVGLLLRTADPPSERELRVLAEAGLRVGTVAGDIVTGRARACDAARVAELEFVRSVQLARTVTLPPAPDPQ